MSQSRDDLFLKLAQQNDLLDDEQIREVQGALEKGSAASAREAVLAQRWITEKKADSLDEALDRALADGDAPEKLGGFEILDPVGKGAVGTVYKARQISLDKIVAVKILHQSLSKNEVYVEQFIREAKSAARISHPNIVTAIDAGHEGDYNYFAMEFVEGETLKDEIRRQGRLTEGRVVAIAKQVGEALSRAHEMGILHRDLKPDNLLCGADGVKIADLGLAMPLDDLEVAKEEHRRMGTPFYMSPEQALGKDQDVRSDIYSLGATLYHSATGKPPFTGQSVKEILKKHIHQDVVPPRDVTPGVSVGLSDLIVKMMAKNPDDRPDSARSFVAELSGIDLEITGLEPGELDMPPPPPPPRDKSRSKTGSKTGKTKKSKKKLSPAKVAATPPAAPAAVSAGTSKKSKAGATSTAKSTATAKSIATAKSSGGSLPAKGKGTAKGPQRTQASSSVGVAKESVASRFQRNRYQGIATKVGAGIGVSLAVVFILMGITRLNDNKKKPTVEEGLESRLLAADHDEIKKRRKKFSDERADQDMKLREGVQAILKSSDNDDDRLRAINHLLNKNSDAKSAMLVAKQLEEVLDSKLAKQSSGSTSIFADAERLESEDRLWEAIGVLDRIRLKMLPTNELREKREQWILRLESQIDSRFQTDITQVRQLRSNKDYDAALDLIEQIAKYADPETMKDAERYRSEISELHLSHQIAENKKRKEEDTRKYEQYLDQVQRLCVERDFKACVSRAFELKGEMTDEDIQAKIDGDIEAFTVMDQFLKEAIRIIESKIASKEPITIEKKNGDKRTAPVASINSSAIVLRLGSGSGSAELTFEMADLADPTFFKIVEKEHGANDERYLIPLGLIFTYRGVLDIAAQHFELATQAGHNVNKWLSKLEQMRARAS